MGIYFQVASKLNKKIKVTKTRWNLITKTKHPIIEGKEKIVKEALENPSEIRQSSLDSSVHLYYKKYGDYNLCVVIKHTNGEGFIITAYITDRIKEGKAIYKGE